VGHEAHRDGGDQATWLDLVARLQLPPPVDPVNPPWPDRENVAAGEDSDADHGHAVNGQRPAAKEEPDNFDEPDASGGPGTTGNSGPGARTPANRGRIIKPARPVQTPNPADGRSASAGEVARGPGDLPDLRNVRSADGLFPIWNLGPPAVPAGEPPADGDDPRGRAAHRDLVWPDFDGRDEADADDRYIPPHVPPLPRLDPVARGAWTALFAGPGYLFVATMLQWQVPGWAQLAAIVSFIAGFVVLVSRLGDGPSRRDGPDQGAVVLG
jgi:hypothetical protein